MKDKQQDDLIRLHDTGQPKVVRVSFTVTVEMTAQQCDAYAADHGAGFVDIEVKGRFKQDAPEALRSIPWLREYARVRVSDAKTEKGQS